MRDFGYVAVVPSVECEQAKEVGGGGVGRYGTVVRPRHCGSVVAKRGEGELTAVGAVGEDVLMAQDPSQLEVRVCDRPLGVIEADEVLLDSEGETLSPDERRVHGVVNFRKPYAAHAAACGVACADVGRVCWDDFGYAGWTLT